MAASEKDKSPVIGIVAVITPPLDSSPWVLCEHIGFCEFVKNHALLYPRTVPFGTP
jgi:hypothetical protein